MLIKSLPSLLNSSFPPGLHLPGCSPPLQLPGPGHCQAGGPPPCDNSSALMAKISCFSYFIFTTYNLISNCWRQRGQLDVGNTFSCLICFILHFHIFLWNFIFFIFHFHVILSYKQLLTAEWAARRWDKRATHSIFHFKSAFLRPCLLYFSDIVLCIFLTLCYPFYWLCIMYFFLFCQLYLSFCQMCFLYFLSVLSYASKLS